ncbi:sushi domain-containing protein 1 isoform X1 [Xiphophorus maculatus]|uniref:sushi domain-containing protein 1 isoform X1 n=1 Tax=Xiphophorus maculatus TaxID=8083 RepID=UPI000C6CEA15|nr:sushi domain-containing protein 1 isoform X1 [Xiphophorus maculatus]
MNGRNRRMMLMVNVFLLLVLSAGPAWSQALLDVCATCHPNATCEDKPDGSGKVCNCNYGFVGNGRTHCQDKDECQIGASKICGQQTTCHNTYGSYYCTCLSGYSPSNNMAVFIPNDGTHCQDIDECRITGLCGEGGQCRNLEGSFDCSCQVGYRVHNGAEPFRPQGGGASCKVVDCGPPVPVEDSVLLSITVTMYGGVARFGCEEGFVWRRGDNSSVCGADGSWSEPSLVCEEILCGNPPLIEFTEQVWSSTSSPGSTVLYLCTKGFHGNGGHNVSVCGKNGQWTSPTLSCQETLCGDPPVAPHTVQVWDGSFASGSTAAYYCNPGFYHHEGSNVSVCADDGYWTEPGILCKEVDCGEPTSIPHAVAEWDNISTVGSKVVYRCDRGFVNVGEGNVSVCTASGGWDTPSLSCQEISCRNPPVIENANMQWDGTPHAGAVVYYQCEEGYYSRGLRNYSECGENGLWEDVDLSCEEISCRNPPVIENANMQWDGTPHGGAVVYYQCEEGYYSRGLRNYSECGENGLWKDVDLSCEEVNCGPPKCLPNTNLLWGGSSTPGSVARCECVDGFYQESGNDLSTCSLSGVWGEVSVKCKAKCGPVPVLAHSEVVWHNRSVAIHRCAAGYHSWRGVNASVCGGSGLWLRATLNCIEIKPPINQLTLYNGNCLKWKAEKYEEDTELYKVVYLGSRDYQRSFLDKGRRLLSSRDDRLVICLRLLPLTNYSISITAAAARFTATVTANTSLTVPPAPVVHYTELETPVPTLRLKRSPNTLDPISFYQIFVLPVEELVVFDCSSPASLDPSSRAESPAEYMTAQLGVQSLGTEVNFTVGDGVLYGGFYNAPLQSGNTYFVVLRVVSRWKTMSRSCCVVWAKVAGTSYVLRVSSLCAAASVAAVAMVLLGAYNLSWCVNRT